MLWCNAQNQQPGDWLILLHLRAFAHGFAEAALSIAIIAQQTPLSHDFPATV
jgi:hypothetical protein